MISRRPLVAASIVTGETGHELLSRCVIDAFDIVEKLVGTASAQRGRCASVVRDHDIAVVAGCPIEPVGGWHQFAPGVGTGVVSMR